MACRALCIWSRSREGNLWCLGDDVRRVLHQPLQRRQGGRRQGSKGIPAQILYRNRLRSVSKERSAGRREWYRAALTVEAHRRQLCQHRQGRPQQPCTSSPWRRHSQEPMPRADQGESRTPSCRRLGDVCRRTRWLPSHRLPAAWTPRAPGPPPVSQAEGTSQYLAPVVEMSMSDMGSEMDLRRHWQ